MALVGTIFGFFFNTNGGRIIGLLLLLAGAYAAGIVYIGRVRSVAYHQGYAARKAEDLAQTAKLQAALAMADAQSARQADALATAQANNTRLVHDFVANIPAGSCAPDAASLRDLRSLWSASRGPH